METLVIKESDEAVKKAAEIIKNNGIVAFPTDTVYGLGAAYDSSEAVRKVFIAKGRDEGKPLSILIGDFSQVKMLSDHISPKAQKLMETFWPGALTVIVRKSDSVPDEVTAGGETVGIRMPANSTARSIIKEAGIPLATPSANISGKRSSVTCNDVEEDLLGRIDMIVDGGKCEIGLASTVVDISGDNLIVLREGSISRAQIDKVVE